MYDLEGIATLKQLALAKYACEQSQQFRAREE